MIQRNEPERHSDDFLQTVKFVSSQVIYQVTFSTVCKQGRYNSYAKFVSSQVIYQVTLSLCYTSHYLDDQIKPTTQQKC